MGPSETDISTSDQEDFQQTHQHLQQKQEQQQVLHYQPNMISGKHPEEQELGGGAERLNLRNIIGRWK